jgi:hypothetical protein
LSLFLKDINLAQESIELQFPTRRLLHAVRTYIISPRSFFSPTINPFLDEYKARESSPIYTDRL